MHINIIVTQIFAVTFLQYMLVAYKEIFDSERETLILNRCKKQFEKFLEVVLSHLQIKFCTFKFMSQIRIGITKIEVGKNLSRYCRLRNCYRIISFFRITIS